MVCHGPLCPGDLETEPLCWGRRSGRLSPPAGVSWTVGGQPRSGARAVAILGTVTGGRRTPEEGRGEGETADSEPGVICFLLS